MTPSNDKQASNAATKLSNAVSLAQIAQSTFSAEPAAKKKIRIFDTTLRDGEQAPGASLRPEQKIVIARQLARLGVDTIEPGFAVSSPGEFEAIRQISRELQQTEICGFARCVRGDIDAAVAATADAAFRRLHLFISSSQIHLDYQLRKTQDEVVNQVREMIAYGKQFVDALEFSPMDASRSDREFLYRIIEAAIDEGATIINIPDTMGYALPDEFGPLFSAVRQHVRGGEKVDYSAHCHNDLGMALANSLAAIRHGATHVEVSVNGVGERAGNCALEELVMAIETRGEALGVETGIRSSEIFETSRMVSRAMHFPISFNKPIVGRNAFQHESGIHQDGLLKNRNTYEIMDPEAMGIPRSMIILGKHSGRHAIKHRAADYGIDLADKELEDVYARFKAKADETKIVTDDVLLRLIGESTQTQIEPYALVDLQVLAGTNRTRIASVTIRRNEDGSERTYTGAGEGPLESVIRCIREAMPADASFEDLELHSLSTGEDAAGEAVVTVRQAGRRFRGTAIHRDIILAAARAYVAACNSAMMAVGVERRTESRA
ncbi:2-isopropylmalate synthase [Cohnella sp. OV330]|uniref:2-isopropylmalate synthase n=1 Tax=Cohnella sp. OV330 TaxID=1855288 RepID=UPI0008F13AB4|nr:2-isopropylmalate synthase [Cohnella sp. OV330]SFA96445.1 2-isopropylmalate synthase [Cohnella sp. OV330]